MRHRSDLRCGRHHNHMLQAHWRKYGPNAFSYSTLETCQIEDIDELEGWWLSEMVGHASCCNVGTTPGAAMRGVKFSAEHRDKISAGHLGKKKGPATNEARLNMSLAQIGKIRSAETRLKMSAWQKGADNHRFGKSGVNHKRSKAVEGTCIKTGARIYLDSMSLGVAQGFLKAKISECCNGSRGSHKGYIWAYASNPGPA